MSFSDKFWSPQENLSKHLFIPFLKYQVMKILLKHIVGNSMYPIYKEGY